MANDQESTTIDIHGICKAMHKGLKGSAAKKINPEKYTICRVPSRYRYKKGFYYDPSFVSIGPYHRRDKKLKALEAHKWKYLDDFLSRNRKNTMETYVQILNELEAKARQCYFEDITLNSKEFVEMLLLDGCFIVEFLLQTHQKDTEVMVAWLMTQIRQDFILLENQIPFFVVQKLFDLVMGYTSSDPNDDERLNIVCIAADFLSEDHYDWSKQKPKKSEEIDHLLHLYHHYNALHLDIDPPNSLSLRDQIKNSLRKWFSCSKAEEKDEASEVKENDEASEVEEKDEASDVKENDEESEVEEKDDTSKVKEKDEASEDEENDQESEAEEKEIDLSFPSASKLIEFGVKLQKRDNAKSFMDISFKKGVLEIPSFFLDESRRSRLMNLVAFEQCSFTDKLLTTSSFVTFMDGIIDTPKDVEILKKCGIIKSYLKSDKEDALFFNELSDYVFISDGNIAEEMIPLYENVKIFCHSNWHQWRAILKRDYCSSPWTIISLVAAIILLFLTFLQTFYAVYAYYNVPS